MTLLVRNSGVATVGIGSTGPGVLTIEGNNSTGAQFNLITAFNSTSRTGTSSVFRVRGDGQVFGEGAFQSSGADYAEYFKTTSTDLEAGEVVCIDVTNENGVKRCTNTSDNNVMGVVSTKPAIVGNSSVDKEGNKNYVVVAMLGQIPAYVSTENGPITIGDSLTSASKPGYMMKANAGDSTVGIALQNYGDSEATTLGPSEIKTGQIQVLISRRNKSLTVEKVEQAVEARIADMAIQDEVNRLVASSIEQLDPTSKIIALEETWGTKLNDIQTQMDALSNAQSMAKAEGSIINDYDVVSYNGLGEIDIADINTNNNYAGIAVASVSQNISKVVAYGKATVNVDATDTLIKSGDLLTVSLTNPGKVVKATQSGWIIGRAIADMQQGASTVDVFVSLGWYDDYEIAASLSDQMTDGLAIINFDQISKITETIPGKKELSIFADTTISGKLVATDISTSGSLAVGFIQIDGINNSINSIGADTLKIQDQAGAGDIEFFGGQFTMTAGGRFVAIDEIQAGTVTAQKFAVLGATDDGTDATIGTGKLLAGQKEIIVDNTNVKADSKIFVTATSQTGDMTLIVADKTLGQFTVKIESEYTDDITFDYWIVEVK